MAETELKLKVAEAVQDDVNKGIVRIDTTLMHEIGVRPGDIVEIEGSRVTVGIADRAYPGDIGLNIIRMDGILRRNGRSGIGELVKIRRADIKGAKKVIIAPARKGVMIRASSDIFKQGLLGRAVVKGDIVALGGTTRRRTTFVHSPFEEIFKMLDEVDEDVMGLGFSDIKFIVIDTLPKGSVIITDLTEVVFNPEAADMVEEPRLEVTYEDIGGLSEEIKKVREMVELPLKHPEIFERLGIDAPKGVLLHGPPGTGKTLVAKAVANETNAYFTHINGPEIMSKFYGQSESNLRKKFEEAEKNAPAIVFIDEIDAIASKREELHGEVERRVVAQLLALMDGLKDRGKVVVIAATNVPNLLDPALRRPGRFDREIEIGVPTKEGRLDILKIHTRNMPIGREASKGTAPTKGEELSLQAKKYELCSEKDKEKLLSEFAAKTHGFVGADMAMLCKEAAMVVLRRELPGLKFDEEEPIPKEVLERMVVTKHDFTEALKVVRPSAMREVLVEIPTVKWKDIGGLDDVKQQLKEAVEWPIKNPDAFRKLGVKPPKGILLYGAPGTGKTLLAKAVATESEANFILVKGPELLSKWLGESEKAVREVFKKARQTSPTIIFFDEMDSLAPKRGMSSDSHATERVVNQLLTEIDGLEDLDDTVIIGATNRPDMIDPALLRPGRFDRLILTPVPDANSRFETFKVHTKNMPISYKSLTKEYETAIRDNTASKMAADEPISEPEIKKKPGTVSARLDVKNMSDSDKFIYYLALKTEGYVGADIEALCREAAVLALRENMNSKFIEERHFMQALKEVRASVTKEVEKTYEDVKDFLMVARAKEIKEEKPMYMG
ncbi:CDC48 family AAA ATPase [Candidatus Woesearchaeota archaeon]|nr:CDC48 family AAA ATPase [Candidatus Woesearchaeota archaeon]